MKTQKWKKIGKHSERNGLKLKYFILVYQKIMITIHQANLHHFKAHHTTCTVKQKLKKVKKEVSKMTICNLFFT